MKKKPETSSYQLRSNISFPHVLLSELQTYWQTVNQKKCPSWKTCTGNCEMNITLKKTTLEFIIHVSTETSVIFS